MKKVLCLKVGGSWLVAALRFFEKLTIFTFQALLGFQGIKQQEYDKKRERPLPQPFPHIPVGSVIPRRVAPQQSSLPFHRTR